MRRLGWIPDPTKVGSEKRDLSATTVLNGKPFPVSASLRPFIVDVLDQGALSSCVANAGMQAIRANHVKQLVQEGTSKGLFIGVALAEAKAKARLGSRLWAYYMARSLDHTSAFDNGAHIRNLFTMINKVGLPPESVWPYSDNKAACRLVNGTWEVDPYFPEERAPYQQMPKQAAFRAAFDQRSPTVYQRIYETGYARIDEIKRALSQGYCVVFGTDISEEFVHGGIGALPLDPPHAKRIAGGHAMTIAEYNYDIFGIVNSWGTAWGSNGWFRMTADYLAWENTRDIWICSHAPRFSV